MAKAKSKKAEQATLIMDDRAAKCNREDLLSACQALAAIVARRTTVEAMKCVLLKFDTWTCTVQATDGEMAGQIVIDANALEAMSLLVDFNKLTQVLRESRGKLVSFEPAKIDGGIFTSDKQGATIRCGSGRWSIAGEDPSTLSEWNFSIDASLSVDADHLKEVVLKTVFCAEEDDTRFSVDCLSFELGDETFVVGTDCKRVSACPLSCVIIGEHGKTNLLLPDKAAVALTRFFEPCDVVRIGADSNRVTFMGDKRAFTSRLLIGTYPPWKKVVPKELEREVTIRLDDLARAIRQVLPMTGKDSGVDFCFSNQTLTLKVKTQSVGSAEIEVPVDGPNGETNLLIDPRYFKDFCEAMGKENPLVTIGLSQIPDKPITMRVRDDGYLYVLLPLVREVTT